MIDIYGRKIEYMRISVTDRCNMRCMYCMPREDIEWHEHEAILSYQEILRICKLLAELGISKIKLTGGEPLVRKDLASLVGDLKQIPGIDNVTLTTNGLLLAKQLDDLVSAGLDAVNISIDSFDEEIYKTITGTYGAMDVVKAIEKALSYDKLRTKVNCVPLRGMNEESLVDIAGLAKDHRLSVRFIEMMPIGLGQKFTAISEDELKKTISAAYGEMQPFYGKLGNGPCRYYTLDGFEGKIGFISAVSHKFCETCNRIRLTSEGFLKTCLQYDKGSDLRLPMRQGVSDETLKTMIYDTIYHKPEGHCFGQMDSQCSQIEIKRMFEIGG